MKNRKKMVLALTALTAVTAGAATTSTLAWFTTTRTASVQFTDVGIYSQGNLGVKYVALTSGLSATPTTSNNSISLDGLATAATDISGDGITFYKPDWN